MNQYFEEQESLVPTIMANFTCFTGNCTSDVLPTITSTVIPEAPAPHYNTLQASIFAVASGLLSLVTIAGNFMVMISFKMDKQLQTISNYFLFSLAVADLIIGLISMPLNTVYMIQGEWRLGRVVCDAWLSVDYLASNASVYNLVVISVDRYFSVTRPLTYRARRTTRRAALMIASAWIISAIIWVPSVLAWPYIQGERKSAENECTVEFLIGNMYMTIVTILLAFYIPVCIMIGLYVRVWWETVKRQRELVHLQAGKKASSKRSDSSDETADDLNSRGGALHRRAGQLRSSVGRGDSQEITYVPTSALKGHNQTMELSRAPNGTEEDYLEDLGARSWSTKMIDFCKSCIDPSRPITGEEASSEGYATPRSLETPVQKCPSLHQIRDPYASRHPASLRLTEEEKRQRLAKFDPKGSNTGSTRTKSNITPAEDPMTSPNNESIYTILIKLPEANNSGFGASGAGKNSSNSSGNSGNSNSNDAKSNTNKSSKSRTSIQQLLSEPDPALIKTMKRCDSEHLRGNNVPRGQQQQGRNGGRNGSNATASCSSGISRTVPTTPAESRSKADDISSLPLDAKLVPKQLIKGNEKSGTTPSLASTALAVTTAVGQGKKKAKKSTEKKQERKAAKTLSAILLAFILTWLPYSVLVLIKPILPRELEENVIINTIWEWSYYLCYINSTINPMLYALCNASFRRTYIRILTCRFGTQPRQPVNRYYYG